MKKIVSIVCILTLAIAQIGFLAKISPFQADASIDFSCGENLTWYIDTKNKILTVSGTGPMYPYYDFGNPPTWKPYKDDINTVIIEEGVTSIAKYAFYNYSALTSVQLPSTLNRIGVNAFASCKNIESISLADNSELTIISNFSDFEGTKWYKTLPDGLIYLGNVLLKYKGTVPQNENVEIKAGTRVIADKAFYNQSNLTDITFPGTVEYVGKSAFEGTGWLDSQPDGEIYIDNALFQYKGSMPIEEYEYVIKNGTVSVSPQAFKGKKITSVNFPSSVEYIGESAFYYCTNLAETVLTSDSKLKYIGEIAFLSCSKLKVFDLPQSLEVIESNAFTGCYSIKVIAFPASVEYIGLTVFPYAMTITVDGNNKYYCSDGYGVVFNKDKTILYFAPKIIDGYVYTVPDGVTEVYDRAFYECSINEITFSPSVKSIGESAFYHSSVKKAVIPAETAVKTGAFDQCNNLTVYCYTDSPAHKYAVGKNIPFVLLDETLDTSSICEAIEQANAINRALYTDESLASLDEAVSAVDLNAEGLTQSQIDEWENAITSAIANLKYKPADYYAVETAIIRANNINRSFYTAESLARLDSALASVEENLDITDQGKVNSAARAVNEAIDRLEYLPADYSSVEAAVDKSEKLDRRLYSQSSLTALDQSKAAVEYGLNISEQAKVNGFADSINSAISALEFSDVVLRNEPNGVIVSATAKEVDPDTALTVDLKDPSDLQGGNIAVGGTVKNITLFDINLLLNAQKVQPNGFVTVKIRLPDGVDPKRCKVYHVIDDPVDPLVRYTTSLEGNFIVFETDHFSEFAVIEVEAFVTDIEITKKPNKTIYSLGETVNTSGMEITAHYSDGTSGVVNNYDVSSVDTSSIGTKTVTVYHTFNGITKSASFEITVSNENYYANITLDGKDISEYNKKVTWYKGYSSESVKLDCEVGASGNYKTEWSSDNSKVLVDSNGKVTNKGFFSPRKATITVKIIDSAGNVLSTDSVTVRFYKFSFQLSNIQSHVITTIFRISKELFA
ncbi:MAG: leucine-rich repeat protein [Acutalibacteraceae bacterium]